VGWHQDWQYWRYWEDDSELFTAWIAISDVQEDLGPVSFLVGSHQWGSWILGISLLAISLISFKPFKYLAEKSGVKFQPSCRWVALVFTIG
jgi:ectoine hydroxylase-related dioxygenase (phytanoyl-CoA dioxygenase family)